MYSKLLLPLGLLLLSQACQASTKECDGSEHGQCNTVVSIPVVAEIQARQAVAWPSETHNSTVIYLEAQLQAVQSQLAGLQTQVQQLRQQAAHHAEQLAALQVSSASGQLLGGRQGIITADTAQPAAFIVRPTGAPGSAWLDHFLLLSLLRHPSNIDSPPKGTDSQLTSDKADSDSPHSEAEAAGNRSQAKSYRAVDVTSVGMIHVDVAPPTQEKLPRYVALGGADGNVVIYNTRGALVLQVLTGSSSPVTAIASHPVKKNESVLVTGHADGEVRFFALLQQVLGQGNTTSRSHAMRGGKATIKEAQLRVIVPQGKNRDGFKDEAAYPITQILPIRGAARTPAKRHYAVWDSRGWLRLLRDNATVRSASHSNRTLIATTQSSGQIVSLSSTHALIHKQQLNSGYKVLQCQNLNGTRMLAAAFDPARPHRAYAVNDLGQLLMMSVPHEGKMGLCKVVRSYTLPLHALPTPGPCPNQPPPGSPSNSSQNVSAEPQQTTAGEESKQAASQTDTPSLCYPEGSLALFALRGYVLVVHAKGGALYNVSSVRLIPSAPLVAEPWGPLTGMLGLPSSESDSHASVPMISGSASGSGMVLLGLGGTIMVMESELPVPDTLAQAPQGGNKNLWAQPILFGAMLLVGVWQFMKARNRASANSPVNFSSRSMGGLGGPNFGGQGDALRFAAGLNGPGSGGRAFGAMGGGGAPAAYRAAMGQMRGRMGGRGGALEEDDDDDEEEMDARGRGGLDSGRAPRRGIPPGTEMNKGYGGSGFAGPRSVRRGMRMGVPPIIEHGPNDEDDAYPGPEGEHIDS